LVCPKHCLLFSDQINLKLLKTETDLAGKEVFILTMDEKGQKYAREAGFGLRQVPGAAKVSAMSDIKSPEKPSIPEAPPEEAKPNILAGAAEELKNFTRFLSKKVQPEEQVILPKISSVSLGDGRRKKAR